MAASLDVMHHLVREDDYRAYMRALFGGGMAPLVLVYGTDYNQRGAAHVLHRHWTVDVPVGWQCLSATPTAFKTAWLFQRV
jgi:hypothetical protein